MTLELTVKTEDAGTRLDAFIAAHAPELTRSQAARLIEEGAVTVGSARPAKSARVAPGETVALVGPSGGGKSTLCQLVPRFYDVSSGSITLDGLDVRRIRQRDLRRSIGIVQQDVFLFADTIRENIRYGRPDATDAEVEQAARKAELLEDIQAMPDGFDTYVGERGTLLSGGQKQRVAIARALANDPQVLLCDEATSALDPQTTKAILHLLKQLNETLGITIVLITHEMAVVKEICDRVAVMEYGRVVEQGEVFTVFAEPKQDITKSFIHTTSNLQKVEALIAEDSPVTRLQPGELIVRLSYVQRNVNEPIISAVSQMFNVSLNIIFADITIVQDSPIGGTVAIISGERKQITKAIEYLIEKNVGVEVIKDARADR